jgi:hypothetical protein
MTARALAQRRHVLLTILTTLGGYASGYRLKARTSANDSEVALTIVVGYSCLHLVGLVLYL